MNLGLRKQANKRLVGFHEEKGMNTTTARCRAARCYDTGFGLGPGAAVSRIHKVLSSEKRENTRSWGMPALPRGLYEEADAFRCFPMWDHLPRLAGVEVGRASWAITRNYQSSDALARSNRILGLAILRVFWSLR